MDPSSTVLTGETVLTAKDLSVAFAKISMFRYRWWYLAGAVLLIVIAWAWSHASIHDLLPFLIFTAVFQVLLFLGPFLLARRRLAAMSDRKTEYHIDTEKISITMTDCNVTFRWDRMLRFSEEPAMFLVWLGPYAVQVIPKRIFSLEEVKKLRQILCAQTKAEAGWTTGGWRIVLWIFLVLGFLAIWQFLSQRGSSTGLP
jgi:YcxB-like protein